MHATTTFYQQPEITSEVENNIYYLYSLQNRFDNQRVSSEGTSFEISPIYYENPLSILPPNQKAWFVTSAERSYSQPNFFANSYPFVFAGLTTVNRPLEFDLMEKVKNIDRIKRVYLSQNQNLTLIKVVLDESRYDYELRERIINEVEFPIKDIHKNILMDFMYIPDSSDTQNLLSTELDNLIFDRESYNKLEAQSPVNYLELEYEDFKPRELVKHPTHVWQI